MKVRVTNLLSKIDRLKQKNKGLFQRNRKLQKTSRKHIIINRVLKKEIINMKKQERLHMLVAVVATLWLLPVFDFLLPEDRQRLQFGGLLVSSFDHVFAYTISQRPPSLYPVPPLLPLFWHNWHLPTIQWGYLRYLYVSSYFYAFWCFKLILKLMSLELGTISIYRICQYQVPARTPWRYQWSRSRSARYGQNGR